MKNFLLILLSVLSLTAVANETIALLEPRVGEGSDPVTPMEKSMIRGELRKAIVKFPGYDAITRTDIDQMMKEQNFQRTGMVSEDQIKKLSEMDAADYICVSTLSKSKTEFYLEAYLIHLESGRMLSPASKYGELSDGKLTNMFPACQELARELLGDNSAVKGELHLPEGKYVGEIRNGKPHGKGILYYKESDEKERTIYDGEWRNGIQHGKGILKWKNGAKYEGDWDNGEWNGEGTYYFEEGHIYTGGWKNSEYSGHGTLIQPDGGRYEGDFEDGKANGQGTFYAANGCIYVGNWKNWEKSGQGVFTFPNGDRYEGNFENDVINGYGTFSYADGTKHIGYWKDGEQHGKGTLYNSFGRYEGVWVNGHLNGAVTIYGTDGSKYIGSFVNDNADGEWIRISADGKRTTAIYSDGDLIRDWQ